MPGKPKYVDKPCSECGTLCRRRRSEKVAPVCSPTCRSKQHTKFMLANPREQRGASNPNWKGGITKTKRYADDFKKKFPKKVRCHIAVAKAIKQGVLVPQPCEWDGCGTTERIEAHHPDYNKPLQVNWLCKPHHIEWHLHNQALNGEEAA